MSYCLNPNCLSPQNPDDAEYCQRCQTRLLLNDRYRPLDPIGRGGFGRTFKARDEYKPSKPYCVIKQFHGKGFDDAAKAKELFHREAELQEKLGKHPQIPEFLALCPQDNYLYLVQEFIDGCSLNQELKEKSTFSEDKIWQLLKDLLPVLQFVHTNEVIHRDVKPENIIRHSADDKLFLVDFGIAKLATEAILAKTGTVIGSEGYTAPEQHEGKPYFASDNVSCLAINPDSQTLVSGSFDKTIQLWDLNTGELIRTLFNQSRCVNSVAISPDDQTLAISSYGVISLLDLATGKQVFPLCDLSGWINAIAISMNGQTLAAGGSDVIIKIWKRD